MDQLNNSSIFTFYSPRHYRENTHIREMDEVYRFTTTVYLHLETGIRCEYNIHESYFGEDEYKLGKLFIITNDNKNLDIIDCDFEKGFITTSEGKITFAELKRHVDETD